MHIPEAELQEEEAELTQGSGDAGKTGGLRRRRRAYSRTLQEHIKPGKQYSTDLDQQRAGTMGINICIVLISESNISATGHKILIKPPEIVFMPIRCLFCGLCFLTFKQTLCIRLLTIRLTLHVTL